MTQDPDWRSQISEARKKNNPGGFKKGSTVNLGRTWTEAQKKKRGEKWIGENNPKWKGGVSTENAILRGSSEMKTWRKAIFKRDDYTCQFCGTRGGNLNADHIKPFATHPELRFDLDNGRTLCVPCHKEITAYV